MVSNWSLWGIALLLSLSLCLGQITPIRSERCNYVDLGLLLDSSGSIVDEEAWVYEQRFVKQIISRMYVGPDEDHVGMVTFSSTVKILFNLTTFYDLTDMYNTIDITRALDANTYTGLGLRTLREVTFNVSNGDRPNVPDVAIVIMDGMSNVFPEQTITEARNLKAAGVRVLVIGITSSINVTELQIIASNLSDVIIVDTYANLSSIVDDIVGKACIPDYGPAECQKKLDLALILEESSSIIFSDPDAWVRDILGFLNNFLKDFNVSQSETRVAAVEFSDTAQILFDFYRYNTTEQLLPAIRRLPFAGGQTNTAAGLRVAASLFSNKTRTNVVNVAFLITDGIPSGVDKDKTPAEADNLISQGVEVFVVGISDEVGRNDENVKIIASIPTASHYFYVDMFTDLQTIVKNLTTGVCNALGTTTTPLPTSSTTTTTTSTTPTPSTTTSTTTTSTTSSTTSTSTPTSSSTPTSTTATSTASTTTAPISPTLSTSGGSGTSDTASGSPGNGNVSLTTSGNGTPPLAGPQTGSTSPGSPTTSATPGLTFGGVALNFVFFFHSLKLV